MIKAIKIFLWSILGLFGLFWIAWTGFTMHTRQWDMYWLPIGFIIKFSIIMIGPETWRNISVMSTYEINGIEFYFPKERVWIRELRLWDNRLEYMGVKFSIPENILLYVRNDKTRRRKELAFYFIKPTISVSRERFRQITENTEKYMRAEDDLPGFQKYIDGKYTKYISDGTLYFSELFMSCGSSPNEWCTVYYAIEDNNRDHRANMRFSIGVFDLNAFQEVDKFVRTQACLYVSVEVKKSAFCEGVGANG